MFSDAPCLNIYYIPTSALIFKGTAGSSPPVNPESTGSFRRFVINRDQNLGEDLFSSEINRLIEDFGLGKDQLSKILQISRPTLNAWLNNQNSRLTEANRKRVVFIKQALYEVEQAGYAKLLGSMLKKRLDEDCCRLYDVLVSEKMDVNEVKNAIKQAKYRFIGQKNSLLLDELLSDVEPLA